MANQGKVQLSIIIIAPPDQAEEGDRVFASHGPWMEKTHHREGSKALLSYNVSKAPELSNPMDPTSAPTDKTCFVVTEIYETMDGVADHFAQAQGSWEDIPAFMEWIGKCKVTMVPGAPISNFLW